MGILTLCCLFIARLCFAAVLAALVGCLTEGERAEPPFPTLTSVFPSSSRAQGYLEGKQLLLNEVV